uniref:Uncharacterized protein n=1 Tax=Kalanchoe fedtschenkoi TaxID=63787 RepID=A0A7N0ULW3_KALFE
MEARLSPCVEGPFCFDTKEFISWLVGCFLFSICIFFVFCFGREDRDSNNKLPSLASCPHRELHRKGHPISLLWAVSLVSDLSELALPSGQTGGSSDLEIGHPGYPDLLSVHFVRFIRQRRASWLPIPRLNESFHLATAKVEFGTGQRATRNSKVERKRGGKLSVPGSPVAGSSGTTRILS